VFDMLMLSTYPRGGLDGPSKPLCPSRTGAEGRKRSRNVERRNIIHVRTIHVLFEADARLLWAERGGVGCWREGLCQRRRAEDLC
jgi:hypothetical protein